MALIYFYQVKPIDIEQLSTGLQGTDHRWEFVPELMTLDNLDPETEVISTFVDCTLTREMIDKLPKLKLIAARSTGYNNIDRVAAHERGIPIVNVPAYGEQTVAEFAFALLLNLTRKITQMQKEPDDVQEMGIDLRGKTFGVVGTGRIGKKAIQIAKGFAMNVIAYDVYKDEQHARETGYDYVELDDLLERSDVVSLHMPLLESTQHIINAQNIRKMKRGAILINTSRGELVDTVALVHALYDGHLGGAGLDTVEGEKYLALKNDVHLLQAVSDNPEQAKMGIALMALKKMPNVIVTPHAAFDTNEAIGRINATTVENIVNFWKGELPNEVKYEQVLGKLYLVRHTTSEWNGEGKWTGTRDVHLSETGFNNATEIGKWFRGKPVAKVFCSHQMRTFETMKQILDTSGQPDVPYVRCEQINERDYGDYTGKNKWEMKELLGDEKFESLRREWDYPVPNGETLKMVYERVVPFYQEKIMPELRRGQDILIVAHGNSLRALMKYIDSVPDEEMVHLEMLFGSVVEYRVDNEGRAKAKSISEVVLERPTA
jgi:D-lactate dehydrogenase